jgi:hypothetical protein
MKTFIAVFCFVLTSCVVLAQESNSPYVFATFKSGSVYLTNGDSASRVINYNAATEELVYEQGGKLMALDNLSLVKSVKFGENIFEPIDGKFYQKLGNQGLFVKYKFRIVPPSAPSAYGGDGNTSSSTSWTSLTKSGVLYELKLPTEYKLIKSKDFLFYKGSELNKVNRISQVVGLFPSKEKELKTFIKTNKLDWSVNEDVQKIIGFCLE